MQGHSSPVRGWLSQVVFFPEITLPPAGAEEERVDVNEMRTYRAISNVNFAGPTPAGDLSDALARPLQSQRSRSKKGLAFGWKESMCVEARGR
jgi:hypothetical protein